jgi:short-subunit dehydrogenase
MPRVLITGCSSGIGRALAEELVSRGLEVIATDVDVLALEGVPATMRLQLDVTSDASVQAAVARAGEIDVLVNNAGVGIYAPVEAVSMDAARHLFEVNVFGVLRMIHAVVPQMRARRSGLIVQHSSVLGRLSKPLQGHYAGSKQALEALSEALRVELAEFGVKVAILEFGPVDSNFSAKAASAVPVTSGDYAGVMARFHRIIATPPPRTSAADAARAIADAIGEGGDKLRYEGTPKAFAAIAARRALDDADWEEVELGRLGTVRP